MSITPSHIIEYLYCPRFTFFEYVLCIPQYEERRYKVKKGRHMHDQKLIRNKDYLRKRIGASEKYPDQYLCNGLLRGVVDEVLLLSDGTMAPLDYKFAKYQDYTFKTHRIQQCCYAMLIEDNFGKTVRKGFIVYIRSANKLVEIEIKESDIAEIRLICNKINEIISENKYPPATKYKQRCIDCTYQNICIR
ncbi:MAG: CRISPR-associated protein Cas4 [Sphaerochaetaceae bacterium]|nr:CRISPR-associated protein Cas4 [Sphaerochaetaceae bacterium]